jgi:iron complex transport system ATP-binding protein
LELVDLYARRQVLRGVSCSLRSGEVVGLIGPNGAGKSTLLRAMLGLVRSEGAITLDGASLSEFGPDQRARLLAYLPQEREVAWPISVERLVALGRTPYLQPMKGFSPEDTMQVERAMEEMEVSGMRHRVVSELSGGERARVLIARAVAQDTPILLADEPTAGLDPAHQIALMEVFAALAARGRIVIVSLHELSLAARWCHRLLLLDDGLKAAEGTPSEVLTAANLERTYGVQAYLAQSPSGLIVQPVTRTGRGDPR